MSTRRITIYHNMGQVDMPTGLVAAIFSRWGDDRYREGDPMAPAFSFQVEADSVQEALGHAFAIGNGMPPSSLGETGKRLSNEYYAEEVRSLSAGDVVSVDGEAWACAPVGWTHVGLAAGLTFLGGRTARLVEDAILRVLRSKGTPEDERLVAHLTVEAMAQ